MKYKMKSHQMAINSVVSKKKGQPIMYADPALASLRMTQKSQRKINYLPKQRKTK